MKNIIFADVLKINEILMKKLILINILLALCSVMGMAQSVDILKADPEYVWGEGTGSNVRTADR